MKTLLEKIPFSKLLIKMLSSFGQRTNPRGEGGEGTLEIGLLIDTSPFNSYILRSVSKAVFNQSNVCPLNST